MFYDIANRAKGARILLLVENPLYFCYTVIIIASLQNK